ncbi:hypothetical protein LJC45_03215 [Alistipes sp. OttesenSCG-928-B03]|nr:hypothetical protein [Alistipes sp. OttesenSCG-928-B03]
MKQSLLFALFVPIICCCCCSCKPVVPEWNDFVGVWATEDGGKLFINADSTCKAVDLHIPPFEWMTGYYINFDGKWEFRKDYYGGQKLYHLNFRPSSKPYELDLFIEGENGMFMNRPPWVLFIWLGDPDEMNKFRLHKVRD